jgi:hypothetical protein
MTPALSCVTKPMWLKGAWGSFRIATDCAILDTSASQVPNGSSLLAAQVRLAASEDPGMAPSGADNAAPDALEWTTKINLVMRT